MENVVVARKVTPSPGSEAVDRINNLNECYRSGSFLQAPIQSEAMGRKVVAGMWID